VAIGGISAAKQLDQMGIAVFVAIMPASFVPSQLWQLHDGDATAGDVGTEDMGTAVPHAHRSRRIDSWTQA